MWLEFQAPERHGRHLCALAVGTETDGSVVCPATPMALWVSADLAGSAAPGIIPIAHSQDTADPWRERSAIAAICSTRWPRRSRDSRPPRDREIAADYTAFSIPTDYGWPALVWHANIWIQDSVDRLMDGVMAEDEEQGRCWSILTIWNLTAIDDTEFLVLLYELKADLNAYLAGRRMLRSFSERHHEFNERTRTRRCPISSWTFYQG